MRTDRAEWDVPAEESCRGGLEGCCFLIPSCARGSSIAAKGNCRRSVGGSCVGINAYAKDVSQYGLSEIGWLRDYRAELYSQSIGYFLHSDRRRRDMQLPGP